ncbi:MAG: STAS-like domain-containing protein [Gemmatimonadota bacterium]|nr:STAS-like domain-containing protein [Gemmatimonadota bacterium]
MAWIDLKDILQHTVSSVYGDLVTRPTGQAVRTSIEALLPAADEDLAIIDFSTVRLMDFSCADEIVGKLLLRYGRARYFLLVGVHPGHEDAIEPVLERHRLAVVAQDRSGSLKLLGAMPEHARQAFTVLADSGPALLADVAAKLALSPDTAREALEVLRERHVVRESGGHYQAVRSA